MLPIESECVQRAIFWGVRGMRDQGRELTGRSSWPGLLGLDQAVADGLGGGQRAASARVVPDLVNLTTGHLGQPEVQRVDHAGQLLLLRGDRGHGATELELRLDEHEGGVGVAGPARAGHEYAEARAADLAAHARMHRYAQDVQDA